MRHIFAQYQSQLQRIVEDSKGCNHPFKADIKDALSSSFNKVWQRGKRGERIEV